MIYADAEYENRYRFDLRKMVYAGDTNMGVIRLLTKS